MMVKERRPRAVLSGQRGDSSEKSTSPMAVPSMPICWDNISRVVDGASNSVDVPPEPPGRDAVITRCRLSVALSINIHWIRCHI